MLLVGSLGSLPMQLKEHVTHLNGFLQQIAYIAIVL